MPQGTNLVGFLSYAREDDDDQQISRLRDALEREIRKLVGRRIPIFQDVKDLGWGREWSPGINEALDASVFLFVVATPTYFDRSECRRELERFLAQASVGKARLILPLRYIAHPAFTLPREKVSDSLVLAIWERTWIDWQPLRLKSLRSVVVRKKIAEAAEHVRKLVEVIDGDAPADTGGFAPLPRGNGEREGERRGGRSAQAIDAISRELSCDSRRAVDWLGNLQEDKGDAVGGWGQFGNDDANSLNTAEVVLALVECGGDALVIESGLAFLVRQQMSDDDGDFPGHGGAWGRRPKRRPHQDFRVPDTVRTCHALMALIAGGRGSDAPAARTAVNRLLKCQTGGRCGGWAFRPSADFPPKVFPTSLALCALLTARDTDGDVRSERGIRAIKCGVRYLQGEAKGGHFGNDEACKVAHTIHALRALGLARKTGFADLIDDDQVSRSEAWLADQGDDLARFSHEWIDLAGESGDKAFNYQYTHYTPALFISAFAAELAPDDPAVRICAEAILRNRDPLDHGFSAMRSLSWATAKCVVAAKTLNDRLSQP
ncbi:MAG: TIR domain-containing protein [Rhodospirillales bacterium]|nr:TIR domain-containing protein [Rhodospirillales bacterium]